MTNKERLDIINANIIIVANIPEKLKSDFKAKCALKRITMREAFINFMEEFIK